MRRLAVGGLLLQVALCVAVLAVSSAQAVTLGLEPTSSNAGAGDLVSIDLVISGLSAGGPDSLGDFDIDVAFDPSALSLAGFSLGSGLGDLGLGEALDFSLGDIGGGLVNLAEVSLLETDAGSCVFCIPPYLDDLQAGSFVLATLDFNVDVLAVGDATSVSVATVFALGDGFGSALTLDGTTAAVIQNPIPEPGAAVVFAAGLLITSRVLRRRNR